MEGVFEPVPVVAHPDDCDVFHFPSPRTWSSMRRGSELGRWSSARAAALIRREERPGELLFWARVAGRRATPAMIGYMADMVPMSVVHATGHLGGGTSLDNTVRIGRPADTEWVLLQLDPHAGHRWVRPRLRARVVT